MRIRLEAFSVPERCDGSAPRSSDANVTIVPNEWLIDGTRARPQRSGPARSQLSHTIASARHARPASISSDDFPWRLKLGEEVREECGRRSSIGSAKISSLNVAR